MSCPACEEAQVPDETNAITGLKQATYVRVGRANVLIAGCEEHLTELIQKLRKAHEAEVAEHGD